MHLYQIEIAGYRSIREQITVPIDPRITTILGANDHGKSNILAALLHLNDDSPFTADDLNWDRVGQEGQFPVVRHHFRLTSAEKDAARRLLVEVIDGDPEATQEDFKEMARILEEPYVVERIGVNGSSEVAHPAGSLPQTVFNHLVAQLPRIELLAPTGRVADATTLENLRGAESDFMRGIFGFAGILPAEWETLFEQTDQSSRRLRQASTQLNDTLRASWAQGRELTFRLIHYSAGAEIQLRIDDPQVAKSDVRASRRSSGFTAFFELKTLLHARELENPSSAYIWLFDEPGIYLHPDGQQDLLRTFDEVSRANQIIYTTHSIFMIDKNRPSRHRLVQKAESGTTVNTRPYSDRWDATIRALGLSLPGTILFASKVLLVEGDSDVIMLNAVLERLADADLVNVDLNSLSIIATNDSRNAEVMLRLLQESKPAPTLALLFDGDKGGLNRKKDLENLIERTRIPVRVLDNGTCLEDHLINAKDFIKAATIELVTQASSRPVEEVTAELKASFDAKFADDSPPSGLADWSRKEGKRVGNLSRVPSSVGIGVEYAKLLASLDSASTKKLDSARSVALAKWLVDALRVERQEPNRTVTNP